ncbi:hypothetical protein [Nocardia brasiliensis]|uniref:Uncharacterized protein n=1 Tax=Nocardia brasiliensis (strain ATCC 700358 / HUJEG-1) TaxID=1133849 RepID=K0EYE0_NOCB7|nr:hypothetical protein [Nocardia brasiliensis]AFU02074.1 hypothetical protein O3I_020575 [Nocardia brasiliensis ATCC 700358]OCF87711.1 hypothetical protein AW168_24835 [Nocardia brasiliensis]
MLAEESNDRKRRGTFDWYWLAYCGAACLGVLVPLVLLFSDACFYLECSEGTRSFAAPAIAIGVAVTLLVAGWILRSDRRGSNRLAGVVIAVVGVLASSCTGYGVVNFVFPGSRAPLVREAAETRTMLDRMPGVHEVTTRSGDTFSVVVVLTADASTDQVAQVVRAFREQVTDGPDFREWQVDLEIRRPDTDSSFKSGHKGFGDAPGHAARWLELSRAFPADRVRWTTQTWTYYFASFMSDGAPKGDIGMGDITVRLTGTTDPAAVSDTYRRLVREFPDLSTARWDIGTSASDTGVLSTADYYPSELELSVWDRVNADRNPRRTVLMHPRYGVVEQLHAPREGDAERLADKHFPIVGELTRPVRYLVTDIGDTTVNPRSPLHHPITPLGAGPIGETVSRCTSPTQTRSVTQQRLLDRHEVC